LHLPNYYNEISLRFSIKPFMHILHVVLILIAIGVLLWLINNFVPMAQTIKTILNIVVVFAVVVWLLTFFHLWGKASYRFGY